jgi:hypothetical protein
MDKALAMLGAAIDQATERGMTPSEAVYFLTATLLVGRFIYGLQTTPADLELLFRSAEGIGNSEPLAEAIADAFENDPYPEIRDSLIEDDAAATRACLDRQSLLLRTLQDGMLRSKRSGLVPATV